MGKKVMKSRKRKEQTIAIIIVAAVILIATAAILIFVASQNEDIGDHNHDHEHQETEYTLKVAVDAYEGQPQYEAAKSFAEQVEHRTGGAVHVELHKKGELGETQALINDLKEGNKTADIVIAPVSEFTVIDERMDISTLPFMFENADAAMKFLDGDIQSEIERNLLNNNVRVLSHYAGEMTCITTSKKMIHNVKDVQGLVLATREESNTSTVLQFMNANPVVLGDNAISQAMQQGQCQGFVGYLEDVYNSRLYQRQTYLAVTNHTYGGYAVAMADNIWEKLGKYQDAISDAAHMSSYKAKELVEKEERQMLERIKSAEVKVIYPDMLSFTKKAESYLKSFSSKYGALIDKHLVNVHMQE